MCGVSSTCKHPLSMSAMQRAGVSKVPVSICTIHWPSRCHPALVTRGMDSWSQNKHGLSKPEGFPEPCPVPATSPCRVPSSCRILRELPEVSVTHWSSARPASGAGALHPLELPHLSSYFNLLQLVLFISSSFLIQGAVWVFIFHRCVWTLFLSML